MRILINLSHWRKKRNLTQKQLSILVGISEVYIQKIETGKKVPSLSVFYKILDALDLEIHLRDKKRTKREK